MRQRKLQTKLIMYFSLIAIVPALIIMSMSIKFTTSSTEELVSVYTKKLVEQLSYNVNSFIETGRGVMGDLTSSSYIQKMINKYDQLNADEQSVLRSKVNEVVGPVIKVQDAINGIYVYGNDTIYYKNVKTKDTFNLQDFKINKAYDEVVAAQTTEFIWFTLEDGNIYLARKVAGGSEGAVIFAMNSDYLNKLLDLSNVEGQMALVILDENNKIIVGNAGAILLQELLQAMGEEECQEVVITRNVHHNIVSLIQCTNGWQAVSVAPVAVLMQGFNRSCINILLVLCICSIVAILLSVMVGRRLVRPLVKIAQYMKKVEEGKLTFEENLSKVLRSRDLETNLVISGFIHMLGAIRQMLAASQSVTEKVKDNADALKAQGEETARLASEVSSTVKQVAEGAKTQSEQTQETAELMEQLSQQVSKVGKVVGEVQNASQGVMTVSENTQQSLSTLDDNALKNIEMSHRVSASVKALSEETANIHGILTMVKGINDQTQLLALNASIEAARAGGFGKGFAVIATEVRNLSAQTSEAIHVIQGLLAVIEEKSRSAIGELGEAVSLFEHQRPLVDEANKSFQMILGKMNYIDEEINHTNDLIKIIDAHKTSVLERVVKINGIAQEFACVTEEVNEKTITQAECAATINQLAVQMSEIVKELANCY